MKLNVSEDWMSVDEMDRDPKTTNLKLILSLVLLIAIAIAIAVLAWQESLLVASSGETVTYFVLDPIWDILIALGVVIGIPIAIILLYKNCHNTSSMVDIAIFLSIGLLFAAHFTIEGIWFIILIQSATGDLYAIYAMEIAQQFLMAAISLSLAAAGAYLIHGYKRECDVVLKGRTLPTTYASEAGISLRIQCKELNGRKACKIPRIDSIVIIFLFLFYFN